MVELFQLKFEFNPVEDRLLLRILEKSSNSSCVEYRFWVTRRFVAVCLKALDRLIEEELSADMQISPEAVEAMKKFQHEAAVSKADFSTSYGGDAENCPVFGEKPLLAVTLKITRKSTSQYILSFLDQENRGIHLTAGLDLIHTLQQMLLDSVRSSAWNQPLFRINEPEAETEKSSGYIS